MRIIKKIILPILITGIWINISETIRWELLIKSYWLELYQNLGLSFPNETANIFVWMIWGFLYAITIYLLSTKFNLLQTTLFSWFVAFVLMWLVVWNVGVLPTDMLRYNIPLSLLEAFVAALICKKMFRN
jgi:hypothetical protein